MIMQMNKYCNISTLKNVILVPFFLKPYIKKIIYNWDEHFKNPLRVTNGATLCGVNPA